jgi:hypothetical protein
MPTIEIADHDGFADSVPCVLSVHDRILHHSTDLLDRKCEDVPDVPPGRQSVQSHADDVVNLIRQHQAVISNPILTAVLLQVTYANRVCYFSVVVLEGTLDAVSNLNMALASIMLSMVSSSFSEQRAL